MDKVIGWSVFTLACSSLFLVYTAKESHQKFQHIPASKFNLSKRIRVFGAAIPFVVSYLGVIALRLYLLNHNGLSNESRERLSGISIILVFLPALFAGIAEHISRKIRTHVYVDFDDSSKKGNILWITVLLFSVAGIVYSSVTFNPYAPYVAVIVIPLSIFGIAKSLEKICVG